jgi:RHS repeat-associated protein
MREGTTFDYFLTDHQGSVVGVTDAAGTLISETRYMPFGQVRTSVGTITQTDYGYTFQQKVNSTGLMDYDARMYDDGLGRFVQPDLLISGTSESQELNRYSFVNNSPIIFTDPSGYKFACADGENCRQSYLSNRVSNIDYWRILIKQDFGISPQG